MKHWVRVILEDATSGSPRLPPETQDGLERIVSLIEDREFYSFRNPGLEELANELGECADLEHLSKLIWTGAVECGFQHATVFLIRQGDGAAYRTRVCTTYPLPWVQRYQARNYQFQDPILLHAQDSEGPFLFDELPDTQPMVARFWQDAEDHGIGRNGLCQAFDFPGGTRIGVSYSSAQQSDAFRRTARVNGSDALCIAYLAAEAFLYLARISASSNHPLTATELRFLHLLVTSDDPETALAVSPEFGSNATLQKSIREKLGVKSILQAVALASANRWFDDLPYEVCDVARSSSELAGWERILTHDARTASK